MNFHHAWFAMVGNAVSLWQESGENIAIFCYLITWGTYSRFRSRALAPVPVNTRTEPACWTPSATCSTRCMTSKD